MTKCKLELTSWGWGSGCSWAEQGNWFGSCGQGNYGSTADRAAGPGRDRGPRTLPGSTGGPTPAREKKIKHKSLLTYPANSLLTQRSSTSGSLVATDGYWCLLALKSLSSIRSSGVWWAYLSLELADRRREVEHQLGDVLQLVLQNLDGVRLLLVLKSTT